MNILFFFFFKFILIKITLQQEKKYCDLNQECDNCKMCGQDINNYCSCSFYNAYCKNSDSNNYTINTDFLHYYDGCTKSNNNNENVCGKSNIDIDIGISTTIFIQRSNNANFFCFYNVKKLKNNNNDINIIIKNDGDNISLNINMHLIIYYNYGQIKVISWMNLLVISKSFELKESNAEKISVYIDIPNGRVMDNVSITFSMDNATIKKITYVTSSNTNKIIIFATVLGSLALIIIIIILCLIKKYCGNKTSNLDRTSNYDDTNRNIANLSLINNNKEELNKLFKTKIIPKTYIKNNTVNDCYKCTICLEDFMDGSSIIITTECNHSFHFECFKNWVFKNIIYPKCPNCNKPILDTKINITEISNTMNSTFIRNNVNSTIN